MGRPHPPPRGAGTPFPRYVRLVVYCLIVGVLYYSLRQLVGGSDDADGARSETRAPPFHDQQQQQQQENDDFVPLYKDFPWYQSPHARHVAHKANAPHFPSDAQARQQLYMDKLAVAERKSKKRFEDVIGIPGTLIKTQQAADAVRAHLHDLTRGSWQPMARTKLLKHVQDPLYSKCDKAHKGAGPRPETQFRWTPATAPLPFSSPDQWCRVLNGRHILVVGDLVQYQLHELFLDALRDGPTACYGELNCKEDTRLRYLRNDVLLNNRRQLDQGGQPGADVIQWPFLASNILKAYPILLLNRSPVVESDDVFIDSLISTLRDIRNSAPDALIVFRSTAIGHPYCDDATGPLDQPLDDTQVASLPYGWSELPRRNTLAKIIVEAAGGVFVDLGAMLDTRPDGHVGNHDCLRYCIPGPMDDWIDVLYQVFANLASHP
ncbi:hypothetical protein BC940DRAFT_240620 [Gongronella butleri]|nr:hypothetical protein BC940DRAFT_240620 [Gongronella butleri]